MLNLQRSIEDAFFIWPRLGVDHVKSWNDQRNCLMRAINKAMGFAKQPVWIGLEVRLRA
jgi:hypothetical protein